jgi:hypothetical protein
MTQHTDPLEPTNIERAQWAKNALSVFTAETYGGEHPDTMHPDDLQSAVSELICDLMHFVHFHPRLDALAIHASAKDMFELEMGTG